MDDRNRPLTLREVIASVASAFFGVQSSKNRERDFKRGRPWQFVIVAFGMTGILVLTVYLIVHAILHFAKA